MRAANVWWTLFVVTQAVTWSGCGTDSRPELIVEPVEDAGADGADAADASDSAPDVDDEAPAEASTVDADAEVAPVVVGLVPTPHDAVDEQGEAAAKAGAILASLSAGARGLVVDRTWSELVDPSGEALVERWDELSQLAELMRAQRRVLLLELKTVEAKLDRRPSDLGATVWSQASTRHEVHALIDKLFATYGEELRFLSLGEDVDLYLAAHPSLAPAFTQFALDATDYAKAHPARPAGLLVGWTWSADAWLGDGGLDESDALVEASDVVMLTYYPLDDTGHARPAGSVSSDLSTLVERIKAKPIAIVRASYPSSDIIGGSEAAQASFVEGLFTAIGSHRARFPFVSAGPLHDPSPNDCVGFAESHGAPGSPALFAFWCSTGLRTREGDAKPAFSSFIAAASGFWDP